MKSAQVTQDGRHNPAAAAAFLCCSVSWLAELRSSGGGPRWYTVAGRVWYDRDDLVDYLRQRKELGGCRFTSDAATRKSPGATTKATRGGPGSKSEGGDTALTRARQIAEQRLLKSVDDVLKSKPPVLLPLQGGQ